VTAEPVFAPEPLDEGHQVADFDCGVPALNAYLQRQALHDQRAEKSRTYVVARGLRVVGFFTLAASAVEVEQAPARVAKGQGQQPIPAILLGRLAVDASEQQRGFGEAMLLQALAKAAGAADTIGARAVLVHAIDNDARTFYANYGFEPSPTDPLHPMMIMKDVRKTLGVAR